LRVRQDAKTQEPYKGVAGSSRVEGTTPQTVANALLVLIRASFSLTGNICDISSSP
jgi:hypothetical protein